MKLELKHLAPYLPYRVKLNLTRRLFERTNVDIRNCDFRHNYTTNELYLWHNEVTYGWHEIKPILRPLSDLTKEIEHNGEKFIPIEWFEDKYYTLSLHKECERLLEEDGFNWVNHMSHLLFIHLTEWHFDIFGLIPEGLAIDLNTVK